MDMLYTSAFWVALAQIMVVNIMLSGDNAVVIALASRSLPPSSKKWQFCLEVGQPYCCESYLPFLRSCSWSYRI